jgi:hypothetical protein
MGNRRKFSAGKERSERAKAAPVEIIRLGRGTRFVRLDV